MTNDVDRGKLKLAQAVDILFGISLSKHPKIKTALTSLVRNKVIESITESPGGGRGSRGQSWVFRDQLNLLHNAVIIQGLFPSLSDIKKLLKSSGKCPDRQKYAGIAQAILIDKQSIVGISLLREEVKLFIDMLGSDIDLSKNKLPSPFETLPQLILPESTSAIQALLAQAAVLSAGDTMMIHYLNNDLKGAWAAAQQLQGDNSILNKYKALIEKKYAEAQEFDELLEIFR